MNLSNDLILRVLSGEVTNRPPVWLMRQAGRILPGYRAVRSSVSGFKALVTNPELACQVTIEPVEVLGVDAAIIFSDILVIPEAMGLDYELVEKVGPVFPKTIRETKDVELLKEGEEAAEHLKYVYEAVRLTRKELDGRVPLIGFSGAPWTLLSYMVEGRGSKTFFKAKRFLYQNEEGSHLLLQKLTNSIISYLKHKIQSGAQVIQLFDSWAGILDSPLYERFGLPYLGMICEAITEVPVIVFARGAWFSLDKLNDLPCAALGIDWHTSPVHARKVCGQGRVLQGNLDPVCLMSDPQMIANRSIQTIKGFGHHHIMNLGHGVYPETPLDHVKHFVEVVKSYNYS